MAGASASSREQNFWPGFVDALTNVVLVMVFVVVVFAISLIGAMLKISKAKVEEAVQAQTLKVTSAAAAATRSAQNDAQDARARAERLQAEVQQLTASLKTAQQALSRSAAPLAEGAAASPRRNAKPQSPVTISGRSPSIDVSYALGVTTLEKRLLDALDEALGAMDGARQWQVSLQASMAEPSPSEARRLAFYRIAVLRDRLVAKGVEPERIETVIKDAPATDGRSHVAIRIRRAP